MSELPKADSATTVEQRGGAFVVMVNGKQVAGPS